MQLFAMEQVENTKKQIKIENLSNLTNNKYILNQLHVMDVGVNAIQVFRHKHLLP